MGGLARSLQFDHQAAAARMMHERGEGLGGIADVATQGERYGLDARAKMGPQQGPEISAQRLEGRSQQILSQAKEIARLFAALNDHPIGFAQKQQGAIGLDRGGEVNLLALAIGEIGSSKGGGSSLS